MQSPVRLAVIVVLVLGLAGPPAAAGDDVGPNERAALLRVLGALEAHPPQTVRDYRVAFRELGLVGDSALPHLKALVREYADGPGFDDARAHAFLGDRRFHHPVPEVIAFLGHPFLQTVEEANAREWFRAEDEADWIFAHAALGAMQLHHERLVGDHRYRAGDQVFANVAMDPHYADQDLHFTWADPYATVQVGSRAGPDALRARIDTLQTTYRTFLAEYGERFGLRDLMAPWGGGPDERAHVRSFPDGAPLTVFLYADHKTFLDVALQSRYQALPVAARNLEVWYSPAGALHVAGSERLGEAAVAQMLRWFARQESRWGTLRAGRDAISDGFARWFGARVGGPEADRQKLEELRATARAFAERDRAYPVFRLEKLLALSTDREIALYARGEWQIPASLGIGLFGDQAWALVRMLQGERYRESFLDYLAAWLHRETQHGMSVQVFERAFGLRRHDGDWAELDAQWHRYVAEEILGQRTAGEPGTREPEPPKPLVVQIGKFSRDGADPTRILLRDPELGPGCMGSGKTVAEVLLDPLDPGASAKDRGERLDVLVRALDLPWKRPVLIRFTTSKLGPPRLEDACLVVVALWLAGYPDVAFDGTPPPAVRALLASLWAVEPRSVR